MHINLFIVLFSLPNCHYSSFHIIHVSRSSWRVCASKCSKHPIFCEYTSIRTLHMQQFKLYSSSSNNQSDRRSVVCMHFHLLCPASRVPFVLFVMYPYPYCTHTAFVALCSAHIDLSHPIREPLFFIVFFLFFVLVNLFALGTSCSRPPLPVEVACTLRSVFRCTLLYCAVPLLRTLLFRASSTFLASIPCCW